MSTELSKPESVRRRDVPTNVSINGRPFSIAAVSLSPHQLLTLSEQLRTEARQVITQWPEYPGLWHLHVSCPGKPDWAVHGWDESIPLEDGMQFEVRATPCVQRADVPVTDGIGGPQIGHATSLRTDENGDVLADLHLDPSPEPARQVRWREFL